jgi:hypothetical protein
MPDLDEALLRFQLTELEYAGGLANHGPMAAEALAVLGHGALIEGLVDVYAPRLPLLAVGQPIDEAEVSAALGDPARLPDWVATFDRELAERPWQDVLRSWASRLLPGLFAGACHGVLRVAHAVRSLDALETEPRVRELGMGLAYWAGRYQPLPGTPASASQSGRGVSASFDSVRPVPVEERRPGLFFDAVQVLLGDSGFEGVVTGFDAGDGDSERLLHEICRAGAQLYLANPGARIAYVHCLTAPSCLRLFAHHLEPETARLALGYALQAALALHAVSASSEPAPPLPPEVERVAEDDAELRYRAACSLEEHAIKFTEACLRENRASPDPVFLLAAADASIHLDSGAGRGGRC